MRSAILPWAACSALAQAAHLFRPSNRAFAQHVAKDAMRFVSNGVHPIQAATCERARAAVAWLLRAQDATPDSGVSYGYFPCSPDNGNGWRPSYPETTGYIIPSLLEFAERFNDADVRRRALQMAIWETQVQMPSGAVQAGPICPAEQQMAAAFNTGMVLQGYIAAYQATGDVLFRDAGRRAADFLVADLREDGCFRTHGPLVAPRPIKTYSCLCAWPLYRFGEDLKDERYKTAALRAVQAAVRQQRPNGWFANNCLTDPRAPLVHTIGYALQGILEVGILAGREEFLEAARRGLDPLLARLSPPGFLHARFYSNWQPATFSSCLTGAAQLAVVCYRLYEHTARGIYRAAADRIVNYLKALQVIDSPIPGVNGALPGSFPIMGRYETLGYPSWATKYFLDCLLLQERLEH